MGSLIALVNDIDNHRKVIIEQAFHEASWDAVFDEARLMSGPLMELKQELQTTYCEIITLIRQLNGGNE